MNTFQFRQDKTNGVQIFGIYMLPLTKRLTDRQI